MMDDDKLDLIGERVDRLVARLRELEGENEQLRQTNRDLTSEVARLRKDCQALRVESADRSEAVRSRLGGVLDRLDQLESIARQDFS